MIEKADLENYEEHGYILKPQLFNHDEMKALRESSKNNLAVQDHTFSRGDGNGGSIDLALWNENDDSLLGRFPRARKMVDIVEALVGEEVYHYHTKIIQKNAGDGGAWEWHQDYGYWYQNHLLFPRLCSVMVAIDQATKENGCLQIIDASHKMGRIDHILTGEQAGADLEKVEEALKVLPHQYVELKPGDALFFHCNLLHRSNQNRSSLPRWAMVSCYNAKSNNPYKASHHASYSPIQKVDDASLLEDVQSNQASLDWLNPHHDQSAKRLK